MFPSNKVVSKIVFEGIEALLKKTQSLNEENESLLKDKDLAKGQIRALTKSFASLQEDLKKKRNTVHVLKKSLENQRKELYDCKVQIRNLKKHNEGFGFGNNLVVGDVDSVLPQSLEKYKEEIKKLHMEVDR